MYVPIIRTLKLKNPGTGNNNFLRSLVGRRQAYRVYSSPKIEVSLEVIGNY